MNDKSKFFPSKGLRLFGLFTNKSPHKSFITTPGLFDTSGMFFHTVGFFAIFIMEFWATTIAYEQGSLLSAIISLIIVDIILASIAHYPVRKIVRLKNENVYETEQERDANNVKITTLKIIRFILNLLIIISAFIKIYFFYSSFAL